MIRLSRVFSSRIAIFLPLFFGRHSSRSANSHTTSNSVANPRQNRR